jgi:hypothetical protein
LKKLKIKELWDEKWNKTSWNGRVRKELYHPAFVKASAKVVVQIVLVFVSKNHVTNIMICPFTHKHLL